MTQLFSNPTLLLSLRLLAHPLSLAALALLLANDLLLRRVWPSWWTGKLSDVSWLIFAPWLIAAALAVLAALPDALAKTARPAVRPSPALAGLSNPPLLHSAVDYRLLKLALVITAFGFGLVKTVPAFHALATRIWAFILGTAPSLVRDPGDLLALPALLIPLGLLLRRERGPNPAEKQGFRGSRLLPPPPSLMRLLSHRERGTEGVRSWLILPLAALILLADAAAPDLGFQCFEARGGRIYASAGYNAYVSDDGGQSWQMEDSGRANCDPQPALLEGDSWEMAEGPANLDYRYRPGQAIQTSDDGGLTWQTAMPLAGISEPEQFYILKTREGNPVYQPGPLDAIADPRTGGMIFAMGQQGVLVHTAAGDWIWAMGGAYQRAQNFPDGAAFVTLLGPVIYMAVALALLIYATLALGRTGGWLRAVVLSAAWLAWLLVALIFPPPSSYGYSELFTVLGVLAAGALAVVLVVEQTFKLIKMGSRGAPVDFFRMAAVALAGGLLFFIPYLLWLYGALPTLNIANIAGLIIAFAAVGAGIAVTRKVKTQP